HGLRGTLVRLVLAEALHAAGEIEEARRTLRAAHDDLAARAAKIDDDAVRARFLSAVPENARGLELARARLAGPCPPAPPRSGVALHAHGCLAPCASHCA